MECVAIIQAITAGRLLQATTADATRADTSPSAMAVGALGVGGVGTPVDDARTLLHMRLVVLVST